MPQKFKIHKTKDVIEALREVGFVLVSQRGSHMKFEIDGKHLTIPNHDELAIGTLNAIFKDAKAKSGRDEDLNRRFLN